MAEFRRDPITGRWVIIAPERAKRPLPVQEAIRKSVAVEDCPFCEGNESHTPQEVVVVGRAAGSAANSPGWQVRVVPNKYPALELVGDLSSISEGLFSSMSGIGAHEVIIETVEHNATLGSLSIEHLSLLFGVVRDRITTLGKCEQLKYIHVFKNYGEAAGATVSHPHFQLIATPFVPRQIAEEIDCSKQYYKDTGECIFCDLIRQESRDRLRIIEENESFIALTPYASRFPYEVSILPLRHNAAFTDSSSEEIKRLATIVKSTIQRIESLLDYAAYNLILHTAPLRQNNKDNYHWHIEILPRITTAAGFEFGTDLFINPLSPEDAANKLRTISIPL